MLRYLQQHPGTPQDKLPGILLWHAYRSNYSDSAWKTAQPGNVTALMPQEEVRANDLLYELLGKLDSAYETVWPETVRARLYSIFDPDPAHLSPPQVAEEIGFAQESLVRQFSTWGAMVRITAAERDFGSGLTPAELNKLLRNVEAEGNPELAAAIEITNARLPPDAQIPVPKPALKP